MLWFFPNGWYERQGLEVRGAGVAGGHQQEGRKQQQQQEEEGLSGIPAEGRAATAARGKVATALFCVLPG